MAASAPALPTGFTAPPGAIVNQGNGNINAPANPAGVPGVAGNGNYLSGGPTNPNGSGPLPAGNLQSNGLPVGANINPGSATPNTVYVGGFNPDLQTPPAVNTAINKVNAMTVNSSNLKPTSPTGYYTAAPIPTPSTENLGGSTDTGNKTIQSAQDLSTQLQALNNELAGKATDTANMYAQQGYSVDAKGNPIDPAMADLKSQLANLKAQAGTIGGTVEANNIGRGVTVKGITPEIQAAKNANAADTQIVAAQIAAKTNQMTYATQLINSAINLKYAPIQSQITALTANLKLIMSSPDYTAAEKAQAADQAAAVKTKQDALTAQITNAKNVSTILLDAAKNGADSQTLANIQNAPDEASAIQAAGKYMTTAVKPTALKTSVQTIGGQKVLINSDTGETIKDLGPATTAKTSTQVPNSALNTIAGAMQSVAGSDGYISPTDWANALQEWQNAGYSESTFVSNFKNYANTKDKAQKYIGLP